MGRAPCCEKMGLKKGPWAPEEDHILINHIQSYGHGNWRALPKQAGLLRCGKSCRLRWINYLRPDLKRGNFTKEEEETIIQLHEILGNRWSAIAARLPGRTDNEIKNVWHTRLKKRLKQNDGAPQVKPRRSINTSKFNKEVKTGTESPKLSNPDGSESADCRPTTPQWCSSDVSSMTTEDTFGNMSTKVELLDEFPEMDEDFWTEVLFTDNSSTENDFLAVGTDPQLQYLLSPIFNATEPHHDNNSIIQDNMDFWYTLLTEAGESPELSPEFH